MSKMLWLEWILDSFIDKKKGIENFKKETMTQLECDLNSQEEYLQQQDTHETWVSKDALSKYSTMWWTASVLVVLLSILWTGYWIKKVIDHKIKSIDKTSIQQKISDDTQQTLQSTLVVDTLSIINKHKEILSSDQLQEFEQFSLQEQFNHVTTQ